MGVFTDAPEPLARVAVAQLGASRRVSARRVGNGRARPRRRSARARDGRRANPERPPGSPVEFARVDQHDVGDRQLDALLERLDRIADELERLNRTTERQDGFQLVARELHDLQESLNALAYAALGQAPPRVASDGRASSGDAGRGSPLRVTSRRARPRRSRRRT